MADGSCQDAAIVGYSAEAKYVWASTEGGTFSGITVRRFSTLYSLVRPFISFSTSSLQYLNLWPFVSVCGHVTVSQQGLTRTSACITETQPLALFKTPLVLTTLKKTIPSVIFLTKRLLFSHFNLMITRIRQLIFRPKTAALDQFFSTYANSLLI